jgi:hypothetical protein
MSVEVVGLCFLHTKFIMPSLEDVLNAMSKEKAKEKFLDNVTPSMLKRSSGDIVYVRPPYGDLERLEDALNTMPIKDLPDPLTNIVKAMSAKNSTLGWDVVVNYTFVIHHP